MYFIDDLIGDVIIAIVSSVAVDDTHPGVETDEGHDDVDEEDKTSAEKPVEIISWRRKPEDDDRRASSPSRKRYSPDRRRRQNGE